MTVNELINILRKLPKDAVINCIEEGNQYDITEQDVNFYDYNEDGYYKQIVVIGN